MMVDSLVLGSGYMKKWKVSALFLMAFVILVTSGSTADAGENSEEPASDTCATAAEEEKEAMEIGGVVTVDAVADPAEKSSASLEVGTVELSAVVNVAQGVVASITLLAEGNLSDISIDEALIEWVPGNKPFSVIFGQQTFNHGLLSTHLISDPMILDAVETAGPGITVNGTFGLFTPGIGVTFYHYDAVTQTKYAVNPADSSISTEEVEIEPARNVFAGVVNCDIAFLEESAARLSLKMYGDIVDLAAGAGLNLGRFALDAEIFSELTDANGVKQSGYYAGAAVGITERVEAAVRYDGLSDDLFDGIEHRIGLGATVSIKYGIFCALEYSYTGVGTNGGVSEIAAQLGLESTLKLPGFHRKTLTRK
jgi:hypothetical protein